MKSEAKFLFMVLIAILAGPILEVVIKVLLR